MMMGGTRITYIHVSTQSVSHMNQGFSLVWCSSRYFGYKAPRLRLERAPLKVSYLKTDGCGTARTHARHHVMNIQYISHMHALVMLSHVCFELLRMCAHVVCVIPWIQCVRGFIVCVRLIRKLCEWCVLWRFAFLFLCACLFVACLYYAVSVIISVHACLLCECAGLCIMCEVYDVCFCICVCCLRQIWRLFGG